MNSWRWRGQLNQDLIEAQELSRSLTLLKRKAESTDEEFSGDISLALWHINYCLAYLERANKESNKDPT